MQIVVGKITGNVSKTHADYLGQWTVLDFVRYVQNSINC